MEKLNTLGNLMKKFLDFIWNFDIKWMCQIIFVWARCFVAFLNTKISSTWANLDNLFFRFHAFSFLINKSVLIQLIKNMHNHTFVYIHLPEMRGKKLPIGNTWHIAFHLDLLSYQSQGVGHLCWPFSKKHLEWCRLSGSSNKCWEHFWVCHGCVHSQ